MKESSVNEALKAAPLRTRNSAANIDIKIDFSKRRPKPVQKEAKT